MAKTNPKTNTAKTPDIVPRETYPTWPDGVLKLGARSDKVRELQSELNAKGYECGIADGAFGPRTQQAVLRFQREHGLVADGAAGAQTWAALRSAEAWNADWSDPVPGIDRRFEMPEREYVKSTVRKRQIVGHHTAGGTLSSAYNWWMTDGAKVGTPYVIARPEKLNPGYDGRIFQLHPLQYGAWHLGIGDAAGTVEFAAVGIELVSWGHLAERGGKFYAWPNNWATEVPASEVVRLDETHRGHLFYHRLTDGQIESFRRLIIALAERFEIPLRREEHRAGSRLFALDPDAPKGVPGLYTHCCYRADKTDLFPQPELLDMLNSLPELT